jgi:peptidoglycan/xylan/chitin deacetylase (PgdA/CDA1 family)
MNSQFFDKRLAILSFHKIGKPANGEFPTWNYIPEKIFSNFLKYLQKNKWQVIDIATFLQGLTEPHILPDRSALLTFDDGYRSMLEVALPLLNRFGYPAVLFIPTNYIGGRNTFDNGVEPEEEICDWDDLQELKRYGVSIQSHGVSHHWFSKLTLAEQKNELIRSKTLLENKLGDPVEVIAFPYGDSGMNREQTAKALNRAGYLAACLYGGGLHTLPITNKYFLPRLAMGPDTNLKELLASR